ncbi:MAG: ATP-binding cassette domain-containing protein, partial [Campylobacterales bacterium]|nr:ATP-binding cassette domain-containing protein [Campylobacterales bacterium]
MKDIKTVLNRLVVPYLKDYVPYILLALLGMIISAAGASASAYLVKPVLDEIFVDKNVELLHLLPYAIILVYAMKGGGKYIQVYFSAYIGHDIIRRVRDRMLDTMLHLDLSFFYKYRTGELISRNIGDIDRIRSVVSNMIPEIGRQSLTALGLLGVVIYQSPKLSFFALIVVPLVAYPLSRIAKRLKKLSHRSQEKSSDITANLSEIFNNIEIIKAHATETFEHEKFKQENMSFFKLNMKTVKTSELTGPLMEILGAIGVVAVIIVGGTEVIEGSMSVGSFFSFLTALFMLYTPIKRISSLYNQLQDAIAASERIFFILDQEAAPSGDRVFEEKIEIAEFKNIKLMYEDKPILKDINLTISKGEKVALVGDSGGGKSSLVNLLVRFYEPDGGALLFNGENLNQFDIKSVRNKIATVTQRVYIFNDTVAANVAYGKEIDEERVVSCLQKAYAYEFVSDLEDGIHTQLDENGTNLSGGQRQRIAIARALYVDPDILIFDEATSALDTKSEAYVSKAIDEIAKDKITIIIAHRLSTIKTAQKIAVLKKGEIV